MDGGLWKEVKLTRRRGGAEKMLKETREGRVIQ